MPTPNLIIRETEVWPDALTRHQMIHAKLTMDYDYALPQDEEVVARISHLDLLVMPPWEYKNEIKRSIIDQTPDSFWPSWGPV